VALVDYHRPAIFAMGQALASERLLDERRFLRIVRNHALAGAGDFSIETGGVIWYRCCTATLALDRTEP
jgi:hypothetical protein